MTRSVLSQAQFTPFGLWIRQYCNSSNRLCVTNLDYIFEDFRSRKIQIIEEKQNNGGIAYGQNKTFKIMDLLLRKSAKDYNYDYWGFFVLKFPESADMPGPGMTLNKKVITCEELVDHLNFEKQFCEPCFIQEPPAQ